MQFTVPAKQGKQRLLSCRGRSSTNTGIRDSEWDYDHDREVQLPVLCLLQFNTV